MPRSPRDRRSPWREPLPTPRGRRSFPWDIVLFLASLCFYLAAAYLLAFQFKFAQGDALSRTYSAFTTIYSAYPHLGAVGFIWPPLPTLFQLPLVVFKPLVYYGFAGMIVTSVFGAGTVVVLERLYRRFGLGFWHRVGLGLLFAGNPFVVYYSANGMSEMTFIFFFTLALSSFALWNEDGQWRYVALAGLAVTLSFYSRYDGLALAMAMFVAIFLLTSRLGKDVARMEGTLLSYTAIVSYGLGVWAFLNWLIMGDPLYFYRSEFSNLYLTRLMVDSPEVIVLRESLLAPLFYGLEKVFYVSPFFALLAPVLALVSLFRRNATMFLTVVAALAVPAFQVYMFRQGTSFGFDRFYISVIPAAFILYAFLVRNMSGLGPRLRTVFISALLVALLASTGLTLQGIYQRGSLPAAFLFSRGITLPGIFPRVTPSPEETIIQAVVQWRAVDNYATEAEVAAYIREHVEGREVLADSTYAHAVVLFSKEPKYFVLNSDPDFEETIQFPVGKVTYILARSPDFIGFDAIAATYPTLWEGKVDFARLEKDLGLYRLYRVVPPGAIGAWAEPAGES